MTTEPVARCRFVLVDPARTTDPVVRAVFTEIEQELGFGIVPNLFRTMANQPRVLRATWDLFRATVLDGVVPRIVKEMIGVVSAANGSEYALRIHMHSLGVQGVGLGVLDALARGSAEARGVAPSVAILLRVAHTAAHSGPLAVSDADLALAASEGVTLEELAEPFATIDLFRYVNGFTDLVPLLCALVSRNSTRERP